MSIDQELTSLRTVRLELTDRYPVGTRVFVHPRSARVPDAPPRPVEARRGLGRDLDGYPTGMAPVTSGVVDEDGLRLDGLAREVPYVLYAMVEGRHMYVNLRLSTRSNDAFFEGAKTPAP